MTQPQLKDLLEAGVHFGHQTRRWNPKMRRFIFAERSGIYLIDLQKTLLQIKKAQDLMREVIMRGDNVLFVCTKRQLNQIVRAEAERCGAYWVVERWLGGSLTNFQTIKKQIQRLKELEQGQAEGTFEFFTKKEQLQLDRERQKLNRNLEGIKIDGPAAGGDLRGGCEEGEDWHRGSQQIGNSRHRHRRHERGSGRDHGADSGER